MNQSTKEDLAEAGKKVGGGAVGVSGGLASIYVAGATGFSGVGITTGLATLGLGSMLAGVVVTAGIIGGAGWLGYKAISKATE